MPEPEGNQECQALVGANQALMELVWTSDSAQRGWRNIRNLPDE